jgi:hypothetical protein
VTGI